MGLLESIIAFVLLVWLVGFALHLAGAVIHLLLLVVVVLFIIKLLKKKA